MKKAITLAILVVLIQFIVATYYYPQMADQIASHWNIEGVVDGYMSKFWGLYLMPVISIGFLLLFLIIPKIDPTNNIKEFIGYFWSFAIIFLGYMLYFQLITIIWNLGITFNMFQALSPAIGTLFISIGFIIGKSKRNWFMGIRTPWTLSSDTVWNKTHLVGSRVFIICGVISIFGFFFEGYFALSLILAPLLIGTIFLVIYSYFEYQKATDKQ